MKGVNKAQWIDRAAPWLTLLAWLLPLIAVSVSVVRRPGQRSLDPAYRAACENWAAGAPLYSTPEAFNYLPTWIVLYWPFASAPMPWGEIAWRWVGAGLLALALWRLLGVQERARSWRGMLLLSVALLPVSLGSIQNGHANTLMAACLGLTAVGMARQQRWTCAAWLAIALAIKPITVAPIGLAVVSAPSLFMPIAIASCLMLMTPYATAGLAYVTSQYSACMAHLAGPCAEVTTDRFTDINGLLRGFGTQIEGRLSMALRAGAGACAAIYMWWIARRGGTTRIPTTRVWLALSACYLVLFNPMSEANGYVLLALPMAMYAWKWLGEAEHGAGTARAILGWTPIAMLLSMGVLSEILRPWAGNSVDLRQMPAIALVFAVMIVADALRPVGGSALVDALRGHTGMSGTADTAR